MGEWRIFLNRMFERFADSERIDDNKILDAATEIVNGLWDVNLGGNVYKKRIARPGQGKSSGYRTIVAFKQGERLFFIYGFEKSEKDNISRNELKALKEAARVLLELSDVQLTRAIEMGALREVERNE